MVRCFRCNVDHGPGRWYAYSSTFSLWFCEACYGHEVESMISRQAVIAQAKQLGFVGVIDTGGWIPLDDWLRGIGPFEFVPEWYIRDLNWTNPEITPLYGLVKTDSHIPRHPRY